MSGEPRRSGRATKGQHTKLQEVESPPSKSKKKGGKGKSKDESSEGEEEESKIRCVCGATEDEAGWMMISCEQCGTWQHNLCMNVTEDEDELSNITYYCEECKPHEHKELLAAMNRGEKPWEVRISAREEQEKSKKKGKKGKGGRQSGATKAASAQSSPQPPESNSKRKFESIAQNGAQSSSPAKASAEPQPKRNKSVTDSRRTSTPKAIDDPAREKLINALVPKVKKGVDAAISSGSYSLPSNASVDTVSQDLALQIETSVREKQGAGTTNYNNQYRAIAFNIEKNTSLVKEILVGAFTSDELAVMKSEDMASAELQKERAAIKEETDKQATLAHEEGPRYRKTHKGEELIHEETMKQQKETPIAPIRRRTTDDLSKDAPIDTGSPPPGVELPEDYDHEPNSASATSPTQQADFNIQNVWKNVPTDPTRGGVFVPRRNTQPSIQHDVVMRDAGDSEIDRLLQDDDTAIPTSSNKVVWRGRIVMNNIGSFSAVARYGCGSSFSSTIPFSELFQQDLEVDGRIKLPDVEPYLNSQRYNASMDVCALALVSSNSDSDQQGFTSLFNYLKDKDRWGVITRHKHEAIHDVYLAPLDSSKPLPNFVGIMDQNDLVSPLPLETFLLVLVSRKHVNATQTAAVPPHTPVNPHTPGFSPVVPNSGFSPSTHSAPEAGGQLERAILGVYISDPVAQALIRAVPMTEVQLQNMRDILHLHPETRGDITKFFQHVESREKGAITE